MDTMSSWTLEDSLVGTAEWNINAYPIPPVVLEFTLLLLLSSHPIFKHFHGCLINFLLKQATLSLNNSQKSGCVVERFQVLRQRESEYGVASPVT